MATRELTGQRNLTGSDIAISTVPPGQGLPLAGSQAQVPSPDSVMLPLTENCSQRKLLLLYLHFWFLLCILVGLFGLSVCFLKRERMKEGMELDGWGSGEALEGNGEGETVIRIHSMKRIIPIKNENK